VSPMGVDASRFTSAHGDKTIRKKFNLEGKVVIGWIGSFRGFHGLEGLVHTFSKVLLVRPEARLLLVGDGAEREALEKLVARLQIQHAVIFTGRIQFVEMPLYVASFDIAIVSASSEDNFHYSPLKLREYLAAECAVLAPRAGEISDLFKEDEELLLYTVGNETELCEKIVRLINEPQLRKEIGQAGCRRVLANGTWDSQLKKILDHLKMLNQ
jgi:glycosyltransferase involved in cell wall biosynthesis